MPLQGQARCAGHPPLRESVLTLSLDPPFSYGAPAALSCLLSDNPALCHLALPLLKRLFPLSILSNLRGLHIAFTPSRRRVETIIQGLARSYRDFANTKPALLPLRAAPACALQGV